MAFALISTENGMHTVIPRTAIMAHDSKNMESIILGKRHKIIINGFNEDYLSLYEYALNQNTRRLKVVLEKNLNLGNPDIVEQMRDSLEWRSPKRRGMREERITDSLEWRSPQKMRMKPRQIFQNICSEVERLEGISLIHQTSSMSNDVQRMSDTPSGLPSLCNCLTSTCNCLPSTSEALPSTSSTSLPSTSCISLPSTSSNTLPITLSTSLPSMATTLPLTSISLPSTSSLSSTIDYLETIVEEPTLEMIADTPTLENKAIYKRRICNKPNICKFCKQSKTNIKRHIMSIHGNETEVKEFMAMNDGNPRKAEKLAQIRRDGNFSAFKEGEDIVPSRVSKFLKPDKSDYIACSCCQIILKKDSLRKHLQKNCPKNSSQSSKGMLYKSRAISEKIHNRANEVVRDFLFPAFREGPIKEIIRFDNLIILYGNEMACKYRSQHHYPMIRNRMIRMAKLLLMMKEKTTSIRHFEDILKPHMFDNIIEVINSLGQHDKNTGNYNKPTLPTEIGTSLKYIIQLHISECIKNEDIERKTMTKNLLHLLKTALPAHVNKTASESLLKHKRKKIPILPSMEDIQKLNSYLLKNRNIHYTTLMKKFDMDAWTNLGNFTLISILIFNRRRPGELERSLISDLESLTRIEENTETYKKLSENDKQYVKEYVRFVIRGKLARGVPVLLHNSMYECIKLLMKYRNEAGIAHKNPYIFAMPQCRGEKTENVVYRHLFATALMRKFSEECRASNPKSLRATTLRKHVATKSMSLNLSNEEIHLLQGYLGHAEKIHREYYRQPIVERDIISVSKVLIAAQNTSPTSDADLVSRRNTPVPVPTTPVPVPNTPVTVHKTTALTSTPTTPQHNTPTAGPSNISRIEKESESDYNPSSDGNSTDDSYLERAPEPKRRRLIAVSPGQAAVKRTWKTPERQAARRIFSRNLTQGKLPSTLEILEAVSECEDLRKRTVPQIRLWISNNIKSKNKKIWDTPTRQSVRTLFKPFIEGETSFYPSQNYIQEVINSHEDLRQLTPRRVRSQIQQLKKKYHSSKTK